MAALIPGRDLNRRRAQRVTIGCGQAGNHGRVRARAAGVDYRIPNRDRRARVAGVGRDVRGRNRYARGWSAIRSRKHGHLECSGVGVAAHVVGGHLNRRRCVRWETEARRDAIMQAGRSHRAALIRGGGSVCHRCARLAGIHDDVWSINRDAVGRSRVAVGPRQHSHREAGGVGVAALVIRENLNGRHGVRRETKRRRRIIHHAHATGGAALIRHTDVISHGRARIAGVGHDVRSCNLYAAFRRTAVRSLIDGHREIVGGAVVTLVISNHLNRSSLALREAIGHRRIVHQVDACRIAACIRRRGIIENVRAGGASFHRDVCAGNRNAAFARHGAIDLSVHVLASDPGGSRDQAVIQIRIVKNGEARKVVRRIQVTDTVVHWQTIWRPRGEGDVIGFVVNNPRRRRVIIVNAIPDVEERRVGEASLRNDRTCEINITQRRICRFNLRANRCSVENRPAEQRSYVAVDDVVLDAIYRNAQTARDRARGGQRRRDGDGVRRVGVLDAPDRSRRSTRERKRGLCRMRLTQQHASEERRQQISVPPSQSPAGKCSEV